MSGITIAILVHAKDAEDAKRRATVTMEGLVKRRFFNWGKQEGEPCLYEEDGKELVRVRLDWQRDEFKVNASEVARCLKHYTLDELFDARGGVVDVPIKENKGIGKTGPTLAHIMFRHLLWMLGQYAGTCVWLYDSFGEGLRNKDAVLHAVKVKDKYDPYYEDKVVWVVLFGAHS